MSYGTTLDVRDGVAYITLNRPEAGNALDPLVIHEFRDAAESLDDRDDIGHHVKDPGWVRESAPQGDLKPLQLVLPAQECVGFTSS